MPELGNCSHFFLFGHGFLFPPTLTTHCSRVNVGFTRWVGEPQALGREVEAEPWAVAPHIQTNRCLCLGPQIMLNGKPR